MEENILLEFRMAVHREAKELCDEEFVNDFMFHHNLYGEDIFNRLLEELNNLL